MRALIDKGHSLCISLSSVSEIQAVCGEFVTHTVGHRGLALKQHSMHKVCCFLGILCNAVQHREKTLSLKLQRENVIEGLHYASLVQHGLNIRWRY